MTRLLRNLWDDAKAIAQAWGRYECTSLSAAVAFYGALSIVPFLITVVAGLGAFFEYFEAGQNALEQVLALFAGQFSQEMADSLGRVTEGIQLQALATGPIALIGFLFTASLVFVQIDLGFGRIWDVKQRYKPGAWMAARRLITRRVRSMAMVAFWGILALLVFAGGFLLRGMREIGRRFVPEIPGLEGVESLLIGFGINFFVFVFLYFFLSKEKVGWVLSARSALLVALLWEAGSYALATVVIADKYTAFGIAGSFMAVLVWIHFNAMVLFLGAVLIRVRHGDGGRQGQPE